jgi:hypothetical protein
MESDETKKDEWARHAARVGEKNSRKILLVSHEGSKPLDRYRFWCEDNIKINCS